MAAVPPLKLDVNTETTSGFSGTVNFAPVKVSTGTSQGSQVMMLSGLGIVALVLMLLMKKG